MLRRHWVSATAAALVVASLSAGLYIANRERAVAERRFAQLRQLSNRVIDLDLAIRTLPGSVEARHRLVAASLEYLENLSREARGNLDLAKEISDGYWRLARIQGVSAEFNLGDPVTAETSLKKAEMLIEPVLASRPEDRTAVLRSAAIAHDRMILADNEERRADVLFYAHKTVERLEEFVLQDERAKLRPGEARQSQRGHAASLYVNVAIAYVNQHLYEDGARCARRGVELAQSIPSEQDTASKGLSILANALRYQGDLEAALKTIHQARNLSERIAYPNQTERLFNLYGILLREGRILGEADAVNLDRPVEAIDVLQKALEMNEEAVRKDVSDSVTRGHVGTLTRELGDILRDRDPGRALAVYDLGIRRLAEMRPNLKSRRDRAQLLANSSYALRHLHRSSEAKSRIESAVAILKDTKDYPADRIGLGSYDYTIMCALADHEAETGDLQRALQTYEELLRKVLASGPQPQTSLTDAVRLSHVYTAMAHLDRRAGRNDLASALEFRRQELWRHWDSKLPDNSFVRRQVNAASHVNRSVNSGPQRY
jgi:tetratricopeptide (TPR) repeat protein